MRVILPKRPATFFSASDNWMFSAVACCSLCQKPRQKTDGLRGMPFPRRRCGRTSVFGARGDCRPGSPIPPDSVPKIPRGRLSTRSRPESAQIIEWKEWRETSVLPRVRRRRSNDSATHTLYLRRSKLFKIVVELPERLPNVTRVGWWRLSGTIDRLKFLMH